MWMREDRIPKKIPISLYGEESWKQQKESRPIAKMLAIEMKFLGNFKLPKKDRKINTTIKLYLGVYEKMTFKTTDKGDLAM